MQTIKYQESLTNSSFCSFRFNHQNESISVCYACITPIKLLKPVLLDENHRVVTVFYLVNKINYMISQYTLFEINKSKALGLDFMKLLGKKSHNFDSYGFFLYDIGEFVPYDKSLINLWWVLVS